MKFFLARLVAFLPLIRALEAQTLLSYEDASLIAWRAYGTMVSQYITAGQPLKKGTDFIFVTPPSTIAVRGGTPVPEAITNNDLWPFADSLQLNNDPLFDVAGMSYIQALDYYLNSVDLGTKEPTAAQLAKITQLQDALFAAQEKFFSVDSDAYNKYINDARAQATKQTFAAWCNAKYPTYNAYKNSMRSANSALQQYSLQVYGPAYNTLTDQRTKIETRAQEGMSLEPGYNMPVYGGSYNVQFKPFAKHEITEGLHYKPLYSLGGGFEEVCDTWINGTSSGQFSFSWNMKNVNGRDWSSLGHSTSVKSGGGGFFSILSAKHSSTKEETQFNSWTSKFSENVSLRLTMKGPPVLFNIQAGGWDVPAVRATYPKITKNGINNLAGKVRITKLLLGHQVGLTITISDSATWKSVSQFISSSKKDTRGGLRIFGFGFGAGVGGNTFRNITEVQTSEQGNGGVIVIPPGPVGIPMMLGAFGKAV
ncbi:hypothetical protein B0O99DRAFT_691392 [Bisporella sp. PMI_857]|nr:hypothetical protein B0O99DRAFT_691392 [Bisporella sp. PMI_857]